MIAILGAFANPARQQRLLGRGQREMRLRRRHHLVGIAGGDAAHHLALGGIARRDHPEIILQRLERAVARVEPQLRLALCRIGTVTTEAAVGEQRPDLAGEVDLPGGRGWDGPVREGLGDRDQAGERHAADGRPDFELRHDHQRIMGAAPACVNLVIATGSRPRAAK